MEGGREGGREASKEAREGGKGGRQGMEVRYGGKVWTEGGRE